jgi:hypothetical protein
MPADGNFANGSKPGARVLELGIELPEPPSFLGAYVESSDTRNHQRL